MAVTQSVAAKIRHPLTQIVNAEHLNEEAIIKETGKYKLPVRLGNLNV